MQNKTKKALLILPILGIILFLLLYFLAAHKYPGGNAWNPDEEGFSWVYNYWCDLYYDISPIQKINHGKPIALAASVILAMSITIFFWIIPQLFPHSKSNPKYIQVSGTLAMFLAIFIFTDYHDLFMNSAGFFAGIALYNIFKGLKKHGFSSLYYFGFFCLALMIFCLTFYNFGIWKIALPLTQKLAFLFVLIWVAMMNLKIIKKIQ